MLWLFDAHALFDLGDFLFGNWRWRSVCADKTSDAWCIANDVPGLVGEFHLNEHVALEDLGFDNFALAVLDLNLFFFWHHAVKNFVCHVNAVDALAD